MSHQNMKAANPPLEGSGIDNPAFSVELNTMPRTEANSSKQPKEAVTQSLTSALNGRTKEELIANEVDELQQKLGGYGRQQILIYVLLGLVYLRGCWHALISVFQGVVPSYHCNPSPGLSLNESVPSGEDGQCQQYVNLSLSNQTEYCTNGWNITWEEDGFNSIVSEYTLVCDREYLNELSTTMYMVGATCGVIFLTPLTERFGTKIVMLGCLWLQVIVGVVLAYAGSIAFLMILKFFIGLFNMTIALCIAVMMSETFDAAHRSIPTLGMSFFWAFGILTLSLLGYLIPDWKTLQLVISIPINVLSITYIWLIPQSLPWLLSKGKTDKAERVVKRFLKVNSLPGIPNLSDVMAKFDLRNRDYTNLAQVSTPPVADGRQMHSDEVLVQEVAAETINYTVLDLFKHRSLRIYTCILCYLFLVNALSYFGITLNTPQLDGNRYLNLFLVGLVEIPAYILCIFANRIIGRRMAIVIFLLLCSAANFPIIFIPDTSDSGADLTKLKTALVMIGKFGITGSYSSIYLYASEVFPTVIRSQGVGFCSFFENIGSIAAPNMLYASKSLSNLPLAIFGAMTVVGAVLTLFLPDTHNQPLPQTIADAESRGRKKT